MSLPTMAFVLSISVGRAARSVENVKNYTELHEQAGHMFMSFLWSDKFELSIIDPLHMLPAAQSPGLLSADSILEEQKRGSAFTRN